MSGGLRTLTTVRRPWSGDTTSTNRPTLARPMLVRGLTGSVMGATRLAGLSTSSTYQSRLGTTHPRLVSLGGWQVVAHYRSSDADAPAPCATGISVHARLVVAYAVHQGRLTVAMTATKWAPIQRRTPPVRTPTDAGSGSTRHRAAGGRDMLPTDAVGCRSGAAPSRALPMTSARARWRAWRSTRVSGLARDNDGRAWASLAVVDGSTTSCGR